MARKSNTASGRRNSSAPKKRKAPTASKGTPRESLTKRLSDDPRFVESEGVLESARDRWGEALGVDQPLTDLPLSTFGRWEMSPGPLRRVNAPRFCLAETGVRGPPSPMRPDTTLAKAVGLEIGERGGIRVAEPCCLRFGSRLVARNDGGSLSTSNLTEPSGTPFSGKLISWGGLWCGSNHGRACLISCCI